MNQQPIKRRNPFEIPKVVEEETDIQFQDEERSFGPAYEQQKIVSQPTSTIRSTQKPQKQVVRKQYYQQDDVNREKYTSTMDITLRRQIKIACATRGIMFAKFVEDACREKLQREGGR